MNKKSGTSKGQWHRPAAETSDRTSIQGCQTYFVGMLFEVRLGPLRAGALILLVSPHWNHAQNSKKCAMNNSLVYRGKNSSNSVAKVKLQTVQSRRELLENNFKLWTGIGLVLTVSLSTALHAATAVSAVRNANNTASAFHTSKDIILTQSVVPDTDVPDQVVPDADGPDQVVPDAVPLDNIAIGEGDHDETASGNGAFAGVSKASANATVAIVQQIEKGAALCERIPEAYRISCLSLNYRETAKTLNSRGDYGEARAALLDTADQLDALVRSNRDRTKPRIRVIEESNDRRVHRRALTPVKPESVAAVKRQAIPILEEASTKLLRSASSSSTRSVHYQRIAAAVDSNKVLLRSS